MSFARRLLNQRIRSAANAGRRNYLGRGRNCAQARPRLERLEDRRLLALDVTSLASAAGADALVAALLGPGVTASNVTFEGRIGTDDVKNGDSSSAGSFTGGAGIIGFENGIVLSTGGVQNVVGPNEFEDISQSNGLPGDAELSALAENETFDATVIEFDFVPANDTIAFQYVFSSDEYNEFVDEGFNDIFAFFLNDQNIALLPDGSPVAIDNVNLDTNSALYRNNDLGGGPGDELSVSEIVEIEIGVSEEIDTEMDGLTTVLFTLQADVVPNEINHIRLAIADVGDSIYDSNVFLRAGSFTSVEDGIVLPDYIIDGSFNFVVQDPPGEDDPTVTYDPDVAVGYDYEILSGPNFASVMLPPGFTDGQYTLHFDTDSSEAGIQADGGVPITGGVPYVFAAGGVSAFQIKGIEIAAGVDPTDVVGFPTDLNFVGGDPGPVVFSMTPLIEEVPGIKDPGFPYVDANNDGLFDATFGDVLLDHGELDDGFFDTQIPEGPNYTAAIANAGLSIHGASITAANLDFRADETLTVNTDLTATSGSLLLTSRGADVLLDDPTLKAKNLLGIDASRDIISEDDKLIGTGPSSVIDLDAGRFVALFGTLVDAKKNVDISAGEIAAVFPSLLNPAIVKATPNTLGKVELNAPKIDVSEAQITARKDIVMNAETIYVLGSELTANGHGLAKIDLRAADYVDVSDATLIARKSIVIEVDDSDEAGIAGYEARIEAVGGGSTSVHLESSGEVFIPFATIRAKSNVTIEAHGGDVVADWANLDADTNADGTVAVHAAGNVELFAATVEAKRDVILEAGDSVIGDDAHIEASGPQIGSIDIDAVSDVSLIDAVLEAGIDIEIDAVEGSIEALGAYLLSCGKPAGQVRLTAGDEILLDDAVVRAGNRIELIAGGLVDLTGASLGIWYAGVGNISVAAPTIDVTAAVIKSPTYPVLLGMLDGTEDDISEGTLACEDPDDLPPPPA